MYLSMCLKIKKPTTVPNKWCTLHLKCKELGRVKNIFQIGNIGFEVQMRCILIVNNKTCLIFLTQLSWNLKWAFLIILCPVSVRPSVCKLIQSGLPVKQGHLHQDLINERSLQLSKIWAIGSLNNALKQKLVLMRCISA